MSTQIERLRQEIKMENRKFFVEALIALAAVVAGTIALTAYFHPTQQTLTANVKIEGKL